MKDTAYPEALGVLSPTRLGPLDTYIIRRRIIYIYLRDR